MPRKRHGVIWNRYMMGKHRKGIGSLQVNFNLADPSRHLTFARAWQCPSSQFQCHTAFSRMMAENQQGMLKLHSFLLSNCSCAFNSTYTWKYFESETVGNHLGFYRESLFQNQSGLFFFFCFLFVSLLLHGKWYGKEANPLETPFWERLSVVKGSI